MAISEHQYTTGPAQPEIPVLGFAALERDQAEEVRRRAHRLWEDEGRPECHPEHDWFRAEREARDVSHGGAP